MAEIWTELVFMPVFPSMTPFLGDAFVITFGFFNLVLLLGHHLAFGLWILVAHGSGWLEFPPQSFRWFRAAVSRNRESG